MNAARAMKIIGSPAFHRVLEHITFAVSHDIINRHNFIFFDDHALTSFPLTNILLTSIFPNATCNEGFPSLYSTLPKPVAVERKQLKSPILESICNALSTASYLSP